MCVCTFSHTVPPSVLFGLQIRIVAVQGVFPDCTRIFPWLEQSLALSVPCFPLRRTLSSLERLRLWKACGAAQRTLALGQQSPAPALTLALVNTPPFLVLLHSKREWERDTRQGPTFDSPRCEGEAVCDWAHCEGCGCNIRPGPSHGQA